MAETRLVFNSKHKIYHLKILWCSA